MSLPKHWRTVLNGINFETFGPFGEATAMEARDCCLMALEDLEVVLPENPIHQMINYGLSDAEAIQIASTDAVNDALQVHHDRTSVATTIKLVQLIATEVAHIMNEKITH